MTNQEYDRARLEALPAAQELLNTLRVSFAGRNDAVWNQLDRIGDALKKQLNAEWEAYFAEEAPEKAPARVPAGWSHVEAGEQEDYHDLRTWQTLEL